METPLQLPAPPGGQRDRRTPQTMPPGPALFRGVRRCPPQTSPTALGSHSSALEGLRGRGDTRRKLGGGGRGAGAVEAREPSFHPWAQVPESLPALALIS